MRSKTVQLGVMLYNVNGFSNVSKYVTIGGASNQRPWSNLTLKPTPYHLALTKYDRNYHSKI